MAQGFAVTAHVDLSGATRKVSPQNVTRGRQAMASQMVMDMTQYVPMLNGDLRASASIGLQGQAIYYNTVYARAHFYGTNGIVTFRKYTTPGTGKNWYIKARNKHLDDWVNVAKKGMGL